MANVTYLLGAGASFGALPVVEKFEEEIQAVIDHLLSLPGIEGYEQLSEDNSPYRSTLNDLSFLLQGCKDHASVDTFARMFYLTNDLRQYRRVKYSIVLFFELYYYFFRKIDKRYDAFLSSILRTDNPRLPNHINIISWNYDYELERAYKKYMPGASELEQAYEEMNVHHKGVASNSAGNVFRMVKLNGTSGLIRNGKMKLGQSIDGLLNDSGPTEGESLFALLTLAEEHAKIVNGRGDYLPAISFAWEEQARDEVMEKAKDILRSTDSLVIIGYSFPYFNRLVDKELIEQARYPNGGVRTFYIQDPNAQDVIASIKGMIPAEWHNEFTFHPISNTKQFYMPYEMD